MISENRDPAFWVGVASHPEVAKTLHGATPQQVADLAVLERTLPLASEHGGFLFVQLDSLGRLYELHTLFTPEGWGREVNRAGKDALQIVFKTAQAVTTYETADWRSRPPKSFGFRPCGAFAPSPYGDLRTWIVTKDAWEASPAGRSRQCL